MSQSEQLKPPGATIEHPSSDGKPMAHNTRQAHWIISLYNKPQSLFADQDVFVAP